MPRSRGFAYGAQTSQGATAGLDKGFASAAKSIREHRLAGEKERARKKEAEARKKERAQPKRSSRAASSGGSRRGRITHASIAKAYQKTAPAPKKGP